MADRSGTDKSRYGRSDHLRPEWRDRPKPDRLSPDDPNHDACMTAHRVAVDAEALGYRDPTTGLFVMTATYLRDRGWCCDRGCRHCPYEALTIEGDEHE